jgi:hypothetical protein
VPVVIALVVFVCLWFALRDLGAALGMIVGVFLVVVLAGALIALAGALIVLAWQALMFLLPWIVLAVFLYGLAKLIHRIIVAHRKRLLRRQSR